MLNTGFYPGAAPKATDGAITVELMLRQPTRIARYISDITAVGMHSDRIFAHGSAEGGAILYDVALANQVLADDHTGVIAPGGVYPIIDASEGEPRVVQTQKIGGKFGITDEAAKRNDMAYLQRRAQKVANTMVFDLDQAGQAALDAALVEFSSDIVNVESSGWSTINKTTKANQTAEKSIRADLNKALTEGVKLQMGYIYDLLILHPDDDLEFMNSFADDAEATKLLGSKGLEKLVTPLATKGEAKIIASGIVGTMGVEEAISSTTYRDEDHDTTWTKTRAMMAYAVTDPLAIMKITGLGG